MGLIVAFDFDGTLCWDKYPLIGPPRHIMLDLVNEVRNYGCKTILWTCRVGDRLAEAVDWCSRHGVTFDTINENIPDNILQYGTDPRKVFADVYVDDRSFNKYSDVMTSIIELKRGL